MKSAKVYVIQKPFKDLDLSTACVYGELDYIFDATETPSLSPAHAMHKAYSKLKAYNHSDYLLSVGGDPAGIIICAAILSYKQIFKVNYLRWERERDVHGQRMQNGYYVPVPLIMTPVDERYLNQVKGD